MEHFLDAFRKYATFEGRASLIYNETLEDYKVQNYLIIIALALLTGCAAPTYNYFPTSVEISEPSIDSVNTAYVGDPMVRQGKFTEHDAILLKIKTQVGVIDTYTFEPGYYTKKGDSADGSFGFYRPSTYGGGGSVSRGLLADPFKVVQAYHNQQKFCAVSIYNSLICTSTTSYSVTKQQASTADAFQQTLIYSGRIGNKINLSYREFSGNLARPAFNNDVEYDMNQSMIVGYKGARIEILEATNEYIKYKVLTNFNKATF